MRNKTLKMNMNSIITMAYGLVCVIYCVLGLSSAYGDKQGPITCDCQLKGDGGVLLHNFKNISTYGHYTTMTSCNIFRHQCRTECDDVMAGLKGDNNVQFLVYRSDTNNEAFGLTLCERYRHHSATKPTDMKFVSMYTSSTVKNCHKQGHRNRLKHKIGKYSFPYALCCGKQYVTESNATKKVNVWYPTCKESFFVNKPGNHF